LASFLNTFLSPEIATSINIHVPFSLSRIIMSGLLLGIVLSVCTCWYHNMVTLPHWLFLLILANVHTSVFCPIVPLVTHICWSVVVRTLYQVFLCTFLLTVLGMLILCCYYYYYYYYYYCYEDNCMFPNFGKTHNTSSNCQTTSIEFNYKSYNSFILCFICHNDLGFLRDWMLWSHHHVIFGWF
jgi:hypothetical protein